MRSIYFAPLLIISLMRFLVFIILVVFVSGCSLRSPYVSGELLKNAELNTREE